MSKEKDIKQGLLSEKMSNFSVEPPVSVWENISSQVAGGSSRRYYFIILAAAAGLALAITVGVKLIEGPGEQAIAEIEILESETEIIESQTEIRNSESENVVSAESSNEGSEETPLQTNEVREQKTQNSTDVKPIRKRSSKLEEKVIIAMEEVIDEMEREKGPVVTENIEIEEDAVSITTQKTEEESEKGIQTGADLPPDNNDQQGSIDSDQMQELAAQAMIDSIASQNYLDSLARLSAPGDEILPDISEDKSKWQVGASLSPIFSYRDASSADIMQNQEANSAESGRLSYSGGVQLSYMSTDRLTIESGLYYNRMGLAIGDFRRFKSNLDFFVGEKAFYDNSIVSLSNSIGTIDTKNEDVFVNSYAGSVQNDFPRLESSDMVLQEEVVNSFEQSLEYLEIPFNLKYKVINRDFKVLLIGGFSTNLLVGNSVSANTANGKLDYGSVHDIRTVNYSGNAGLGFVYSFSGNLSLSVEPRFRYYLNSINTASLPTTRPYVLGIYTGVNYSF